MTPFVQFCLNYPDAIHPASTNGHFWCGELDSELCSHCPNKSKSYNCSAFTSAELNYLISNHPELLV